MTTTSSGDDKLPAQDPRAELSYTRKLVFMCFERKFWP